MDTEWPYSWWAQLILFFVAMGIGVALAIFIIRGIEKFVELWDRRK